MGIAESDNRITHLEQEIFQEAYEWTSKLTAEVRRDPIDYYFWTEPVIRAEFKLRNTSGIILCITGFAGTGKSAGNKGLAEKLSNDKRVISFKIPASGGFFEALQEYEDYEPDYDQLSNELLAQIRMRPDLKRKLVKNYYGVKVTRLTKAELEQALPSVDEMLRYLPSARRKKLWYEGFIDYLRSFDVIMFDMPDYSRTDKRAMMDDLNNVQRFWNLINNADLKYSDGNGFRTNLVLFMQKEMLSSDNGMSHYLLGKCTDIIEVKALSPQQLVDAYKLRFKSAEPFEEDAILKVAQLSRGNFRRFLKYAHICIENALRKSNFKRITSEDVTVAIPSSVIEADLHTELATIFTKSDQMRDNAARILLMLNTNVHGMNQKQISEHLGINEMATSRVCDKLQQYGFINRVKCAEGSVCKINC